MIQQVATCTTTDLAPVCAGVSVTSKTSGAPHCLCVFVYIHTYIHTYVRTYVRTSTQLDHNYTVQSFLIGCLKGCIPMLGSTTRKAPLVTAVPDTQPISWQHSINHPMRRACINTVHTYLVLHNCQHELLSLVRHSRNLTPTGWQRWRGHSHRHTHTHTDRQTHTDTHAMPQHSTTQHSKAKSESYR